MSAITGILYRDGRSVDPELIKNMNNRLSHRGLDGSAVWCEGSIALGHQMLWTTPESLHEKLPFEDEESGLVITADARIDNRDELSKELDIEDKEEVSDSYFILKAYEKWGEDCPDKLLGDFAFAIWDKNEEKLFCARDHMGVKPFYYYLDDEMFVFGTEIKALFCVPEVPYELNEDMVSFYIIGITDYKSTFFENIYNLTPAHSLKLKYDNFKLKEYWKLDPDFKIILDSEEEYANSFRETFKEAVNCRLRSAFPMGFELSGGMDSSSIVCMVKKIIEEKKSFSSKISTFSFIFNNFPQCDERYYIKNIIDTDDNIDPHFIFGDNMSPLGNKEMLWFEEQPSLSPNTVILWNLYKKIKEKNIRIALCGEGGDAVVSHGNYFFQDLVRKFRWIKLLKEAHSYANHNNLGFKFYFGSIVFPLLPNVLKKLIGINKYIGTSLLNKNFSKKLNVEDHWNNYWGPIREANTAKMHHYYSLEHNKSIVHALMSRDGFTAQHSIENRYPFLDKRLVEFCYAIPTEMKFKYGWSRYILRIAMENILPQENQWRATKANLSHIYKRNILLFEKDLLDDIIVSKDMEIRNYIDVDLFKHIYNKFCEGVEIHDSSYKLFLVSQLSIWLENFDK